MSHRQLTNCRQLWLSTSRTSLAPPQVQPDPAFHVLAVARRLVMTPTSPICLCLLRRLTVVLSRGQSIFAHFQLPVPGAFCAPSEPWFTLSKWHPFRLGPAGLKTLALVDLPCRPARCSGRVPPSCRILLPGNLAATTPARPCLPRLLLS